MKKSFLIGALALSGAVTSTSHAQTNTPAPATTGTNGIVNAFEQVPADAWAALKDLSLTNGFNVEAFALRHANDTGVGFDISLPQTNGFTVGFALAEIQQPKTGGGKSWDLMDADISIQYKGTMTIPMIGATVDDYIETGVATDLQNAHTVYSQSVAGWKKTWIINNSLDITAGTGVGYLSKWQTPFYIVHVGLNLKLNGNGPLGF